MPKQAGPVQMFKGFRSLYSEQLMRGAQRDKATSTFCSQQNCGKLSTSSTVLKKFLHRLLERKYEFSKPTLLTYRQAALRKQTPTLPEACAVTGASLTLRALETTHTTQASRAPPPTRGRKASSPLGTRAATDTLRHRAPCHGRGGHPLVAQLLRCRKPLSARDGMSLD